MGSLRRGLIAALLPGPALAGPACDRLRPGWDGEPVNTWSEALVLFGSPAALVLLVATMLVLRLRSAWGGVAICVGWSVLLSFHTHFNPAESLRRTAAAEGCVGPATGFIIAVAAICVATVLYTGAPARKE
ncbi:hypothetical protein [Roseovarius salis]|uniref:hypothetical protein n=1 Tax=Roseovarius salis TaxID=3376063 RepID=UPI0037C716A4